MINPPENSVSVKKREQFQRYLTYYCVAQDPFSDYGNVGLFFPSGERKKLVDELTHFSRYGTAPNLLLGNAGVGKSTILREFVQQLSADSQAAIIKAQLLSSQEHLIADALGQLHVSRQTQGSASLLEQLQSWIIDQATRRRQVILCFDDAHYLTKEFIDQIVGMQQLFPDACKLVFCGEFEVREYVVEVADRYDLLMNALEVPALGDEALVGYATYRLNSVGFSGGFPFSDLQLKAAAMRSQGSITRLNDQLREMLLAGIDSGTFTQRTFPVGHSIAVATLLLILVLVWQTDSRLPYADTAELSPIVLASIDQVAEREAIVRLDVDSDGVPIAKTENGGLGNKDPEAAIIHALQQNVQLADDELRSTVIHELPANIAVVSDLAMAREQDATRDGAPSVAESSLESDATNDAGISNAVAISDPATPRVKPKPVTPENATGKDVELVYRRLLSWPQGSYALQVFGTHDANRAKELVKQYFGEADLLYYETRHNGRPWFAVISGPYSGREAAQKSIESLPKKLQRLRPWPRNVASIKSDIRRYATIIRRESGIDG